MVEVYQLNTDTGEDEVIGTISKDLVPSNDRVRWIAELGVPYDQLYREVHSSYLRVSKPL